MTDIFDREVEYKFFREKFPELLCSGNNGGFRSAMRYGLTELQRETIIMYYIDKLRPVEIARRRGVYPSTVCRTLHRAKSNLYNTARCMGAL